MSRSGTGAASTVLVTGAQGFVGRHVAERLAARGDRVRLMDLRGGEPLPGATELVADIRDLAAVRAAVDGVDLVYHVASLVQTRQDGAEAVWAVNRDGTEHVLTACRDAGTRRLVYVSSASVVYEGADIEAGDETLPYAASSQAPYADSKIAAERAVLAAHSPDGLRTCAIRPHVVFGPGDGRFLPAIVARARSGGLTRGVGRGRKLSDFTYIDNLVDALVTAGDRLGQDDALGGQALFITNGEPTGFWEFVDKVLVELGQPPTRGRVPFWLAYVAATVAEAAGRLRGGPAGPENGLTRFAVRYMCTHHYFSVEKARRLLDYAPRVSIDEGIRRTIAHLRETGGLRPAQSRP